MARHLPEASAYPSCRRLLGAHADAALLLVLVGCGTLFLPRHHERRWVSGRAVKQKLENTSSRVLSKGSLIVHIIYQLSTSVEGYLPVYYWDRRSWTYTAVSRYQSPSPHRLDEAPAFDRSQTATALRSTRLGQGFCADVQSSRHRLDSASNL